MLEVPHIATRRTVGLRDIPRVWVAPRRVFARVEDVSAWGWPLLILLTLVTLIGYATVETGLIDRAVDNRVSAALADIDRTRRDVVERSNLRELYDNQIKQGEFEKLLRRMGVVAAEPTQTLVGALLVAAVLYGVTALSGRKAEWHTLLTICVLAGFVDVLRLLLVLALRVHFRTLDVDSSAALILRLLPAGAGGPVPAQAGWGGLLSAVDPFRMWYWGLVVIGLTTTAQLSRWRAVLTCGLCWLVAGGVRGGMAVGMAQMAAQSGMPG